MAPTQPKPKRPTRASTLPHSYPPPTPTIPSTKKDKRKTKHSALLSRITKPTPRRPRRRPTKTLITTLTSLADALPAVEAGETEAANPRIKRQSLPTRPGATKRKHALERAERERFARNMAGMAGTGQAEAKGEGEGRGQGTAERWEALRGVIRRTLETRADAKAG